MTISQPLLSATPTPPFRRAPYAARTLFSSLASVALFALLALGAKEASAYETTTYLFFYNNTASTVSITNDWFSGSNNQWLPCGAAADAYNGSPLFPLVEPPGNGPLGPLGPSPSFAADTNATNPAPWPVAPGTATCFEAATGTPFFGTGGTIEYTWTYTTTNASNPTTTSYEGQIVWSDPWTAAHGDISQTSYPTCAHQIQECPGGTFAGCPGNWAYTADVFSIGVPDAAIQPGWDHCEANDGEGTDIFTYELDQWPPTHTGNEDMSGYPGDSIVIYGTNFDTTGLTQVFFNSSPSPSVICATSTQCTAVVPTTLPIPNATSQVTIDVLGETTSVGTFTFLPLGPACVYGTSETSGGDKFLVQCTPDSLGDAIWIFKLNDAGVWEFAYNYVVSSGSIYQNMLEGVPAGTTDTFVGCFSINSGFPNLGTSSTSTPPGCDSPTTLTMPTGHEGHGGDG
jgi:hypothetical protein